MKVFAVVFAIACSVPVAARAQSAAPELRNSQVETAYVEPKDPAFRPIYDRLKKRQVLEQLQQFLAPLREHGFDVIFGAALNPWRHLGALGLDRKSVV